MEEESTAGLKHGGHVTICRHLLCVATGSYLVLFLDRLKPKKKKKKKKRIYYAYRNCSHAYEQVVVMLIYATFMQLIFFILWRNTRSGPRPPHYLGYIITLRHTTLGRTPADE
jgi:hypothetical protein